MSIFGKNKKHNNKFLKEIWNRIMMKFLSVIATGLIARVWNSTTLLICNTRDKNHDNQHVSKPNGNF